MESVQGPERYLGARKKGKDGRKSEGAAEWQSLPLPLGYTARSLPILRL